jgi:hypothetical protein
MKRTIEVEDTLHERVNSAIEEVQDYFISWIKENPDVDEMPEISDLDYDGAIHQIIDGCVPVYYYEIDTAFFLYGHQIKAAYENSGIGSDPLENSGMTAIYCYIEEGVFEWWQSNAETVWEENTKNRVT